MVKKLLYYSLLQQRFGYIMSYNYHIIASKTQYCVFSLAQGCVLSHSFLSPSPSSACMLYLTYTQTHTQSGPPIWAEQKDGTTGNKLTNKNTFSLNRHVSKMLWVNLLRLKLLNMPWKFTI